MNRIARWLAVFVVGVLVATSFAIGCIRRYPAPTAHVEPQMPYSAIATWRGLTLPVQPEQAAAALPDQALRLAIGPTSEDVFADTFLVDGREEGRTFDQDLHQIVREFNGRTEPVVILVDQSLWPAGADLCALLGRLGDRAHVAVGLSGHAHEGPAPRPEFEAGSPDPLSTMPLEALCPTEADTEKPREGEPR
ncbi:MAG: hypothetical protein CL928_00880 [Deltaproteobacteria bacterium]|nr:hypothetical protein [Deltaproteobacteria bacterium]